MLNRNPLNWKGIVAFMQQISICGLKIHNVDMKEAVQACLDLAGRAGAVYTPNAEMADLALRQPKFLELLNGGDLIVPDGAGVVLASKLKRVPLKGKVAGIELAQNLLAPAQERGLRLFLFGSKPGVAERAAEKMKEQYPLLEICGTANGYFSDESGPVSAICAAKPDVVFVCLGSPKQERFIHAHKQECNALMLGLGGTLDVIAGDVKRAPDFYVKHNLEWLYRGALDPKRWGRLMRIPAFLVKVLFRRSMAETEE